LKLQIVLTDSERAEIVGWAEKIIALLSGHFIPLLDAKTMYVCMLRTEESEGVAMHLAHTKGPVWTEDPVWPATSHHREKRK
jgi:hypothetical protein